MNNDFIDRVARLKACHAGHTWQDIADHLGSTRDAVRNTWRRKCKGRPAATAEPCPLCAEKLASWQDQDDGAPTWSEEGNYAEAQARVRTLEELLEIVKPDLDAWQLTDWGVKRWEMGAKIKEGHLEWSHGGIKTGHLDYKGLGIQDLWSVWAKFVRKRPIPIKPVIQPVSCMARFPVPAGPQSSGVCQGLLIPDTHIGFTRSLRTGTLTPFHDRRALSLSVQLVHYLQPQVVVLLGDIVDLTTLTDKFIRVPEMLLTLQPAVLEAHHYLHALRTAGPDAEIYYLQGNHEERMDKMLAVHLADAYGLRAADELAFPPALSVPKLLALHALAIRWIGDYPSGEVWLGPLRCTHGDRASAIPGGTARAVADDGDQHGAFGHVHRIEQVSKRVLSRHGWRTVRTFSPGCLCHVDGRVPGASARDNWQQGLAVVNYTEWAYTATLIEIMEGAAIYDGKIWRGSDSCDSLRSQYPGWPW